MCHVCKTLRLVIKRGNQWIDSRAAFGGPIHVADMDAVQRSLSRAEHQRALFFQADISRTVDQVACESMSNSGQSSHAARNHDHGMSRIRTAGNVRANVVIVLRLD